MASLTAKPARWLISSVMSVSCAYSLEGLTHPHSQIWCLFVSPAVFLMGAIRALRERRPPPRPIVRFSIAPTFNGFFLDPCYTIPQSFTKIVLWSSFSINKMTNRPNSLSTFTEWSGLRFLQWNTDIHTFIHNMPSKTAGEIFIQVSFEKRGKTSVKTLFTSRRMQVIKIPRHPAPTKRVWFRCLYSVRSSESKLWPSVFFKERDSIQGHSYLWRHRKHLRIFWEIWGF